MLDLVKSALRKAPTLKRALLSVRSRFVGEQDRLAADAAYWHYQAKYFEWRFRSAAEAAWGPPLQPASPLNTIPPDLLSAFTLNGKIPVSSRWGDGTRPTNYPSIYTDAELDDHLARVRSGATFVYRDTDDLLRKALAAYPIASQSVAIMGSVTPWYEAMCIHHGGKPTTIDYNKIVSKTDRINTVTVEEFTKAPTVFDSAFSISSFEHDGLGMYGDPLDPDGDIKAMATMRHIVKPDGLFYLSIPVGRDLLDFNIRRVYGRVRLPMMLKGWKQVATFGFEPMHLDIPSAVEPIFVLRNAD